jgi:hypothetical protein
MTRVILIAIGTLIALGMAMAACGALINDEDSLPVMKSRYEIASHDYPRCQSHECGDGWGRGSDGNSGGEYEGGRSGDNDQRGDHNCRNFCFYGVPMPGEGGGGSGGEPPSEPPSGSQTGTPRQAGSLSLFPVPTPDGVRTFVLSTMQAGIGLGRLFADATIDFVSSILVGIA